MELDASVSAALGRLEAQAGSGGQGDSAPAAGGKRGLELELERTASQASDATVGAAPHGIEHDDGHLPRKRRRRAAEDGEPAADGARSAPPSPTTPARAHGGPPGAALGCLDAPAGSCHDDGAGAAAGGAAAEGAQRWAAHAGDAAADGRAGEPAPALPRVPSCTLSDVALPASPALGCAPAPGPGGSPAAPALQLGSLALVAARLAQAPSGAAGGGSPLLPATQATLEATTARVVAAEAVATALAARPGGGAAAPDAAAATAAAPELPAWLRCSSAGLAASSALCRASLLSTTAALARLQQQARLGAAPPASCAAGGQAGLVLGTPLAATCVLGLPTAQQAPAAPAARHGGGRPLVSAAQRLRLELSHAHEDAGSCSGTPRAGVAPSRAAQLLEDGAQLLERAAPLTTAESAGADALEPAAAQQSL
ncbi:hypothetical protein HT031_005943 [Scenedesmus sp. PABB004]|nr:hypothetical protein HT031_005943 [Scenedesmus sp. PABB004]